jgi:hypothetical protein
VPVHIPSILLEGDDPPASVGSTSRASGGPTGIAPIKLEGTGKISLLTRDPHSLYAHWDLSEQQMHLYNSRSADGHLAVRVHEKSAAGRLAIEVHVHPESRHWFLHVPRSGIQYVAVLGYYRPGGKWVRISASNPVGTPADRISEDRSLRMIRFAPERESCDSVEMAAVAHAERENLPESATPTGSIAKVSSRHESSGDRPRSVAPRVGWFPGLALRGPVSNRQGEEFTGSSNAVEHPYDELHSMEWQADDWMAHFAAQLETDEPLFSFCCESHSEEIA